MIPVHEMVLTILTKYDFVLPKPISIQKSNSHLKEICKKLPSLNKRESIEYTKGGKQVMETLEKYKLISSHTARRSFATNSYLKGHKTGDIMAVTGHKTESSFNRYIRVTPMEKARSFKLHEDKQKTTLRIAR
jgi:integrase